MNAFWTLCKRIYFSNLFFYCFIGFLIIAVGQLPIILHILHAPSGSYFPYLDTIAFSDYYYPAIVRFGMGPDWLVKIPYVAIPHQSSLIQVFFVFLGKLAMLFHTSPFFMIALFRVIGGIIMLIGIYFFLDFFVVRREKRNVFLMLLFAQPLPFALNVMQEWFGKWTWHFGEAARRISAMPPHYTVGKGLVLISLFLFFLSQKKQSKKILFVAGSILIIGGIIYPPPLFILLVSMLLSGLFYCIVERERVKNIAIIKGAPFCFYLLACILPLIFLKIELSKGFPWYMWNKVELGWNDPKMMFEWEYARMLGGYLFLLPIAFIIFMREKKKKWQDYFLWVWCMSAFLLFPFANALQLGKFRFTEGIQIVPLSILGWYGIRRLPGVIIKILLILIICNFILFSGLKTYESTESLWITWSNVYIVKEEQEVLGYLNTNAQQSEVVLADKFASNYLPAFARVKTILGFSDLYENFWDFQLEEKTTASILKGELPQEEAKSYLEKKNIKFIYYQSFSYGHKPLYPSLMEKVYGNQFYEIYRVK